MATLRNLVKQLQASGTQVKFFTRSDRGIVITKVGSQSFSGKEGNKYVRQLFGEKLSQRQEEQLQRITRENYQKFGYNVLKENGEVVRKMGKIKRLEPLDKELQAELRKAQRMFRKYNPKDRVTIKTKSVRYTLLHEGREEALRRIRQASKYAQGFVYTENLKALRDRLENDLSMEDNIDEIDSVQEIIDDLDTLIANDGMGFKEEQLSPFIQEVYKWEKQEISGGTLLARWKQIKGA